MVQDVLKIVKVVLADFNSVCFDETKFFQISPFWIAKKKNKESAILPLQDLGQHRMLLVLFKVVDAAPFIHSGFVTPKVGHNQPFRAVQKAVPRWELVYLFVLQEKGELV
jgi:hypothetical protein